MTKNATNDKRIFVGNFRSYEGGWVIFSFGSKDPFLVVTVDFNAFGTHILLILL